VNLVLLLAGTRIWRATPLAAFARTTAAMACLSVEMQVVTLTGVGSLRSLAVVNGALAILCVVVWPPRPAPTGTAAPRASISLPWPAIAVMALATIALAMARPLTGADPYHLDRVGQILRLGSLEYDTTAEIKVNVLASTYELLLADLAQVPVAGPLLLRLHGLWSLAYFTLGIAAIRIWLPYGRRWCWSAVFLVPAVFHQLVMVKNDLFSATPALVALCWMAARAPAAQDAEIAAIAALVGFAVAIKWVAFPLALLMAGVVVLERPRRGTSFAALLLGGVAGCIAGGLPFTLGETTRWYGHPLAPLDALGNRTTSVGDAAVSVGRFAISLVDFGTLTRRWWPGRGGWGATFGAPLLWAAAVAALEWRRAPVLRRAVWLAAIYGVAFAAIYPDADIAHRLILAPGVLLVAAAAQNTDGDGTHAVWLRCLLIAALAVSAVQIARSLVLYLWQA